MLLAVKADSPFKNLQDVLDFAHKNPGSLNLVRLILAVRKICRLISSSKLQALMSPSCLTRRHPKWRRLFFEAT